METINIDNKMNSIIVRTQCIKHKAGFFVPCFKMPGDNSEYWPAVCNERAKKAGFFGKIDPRSMKMSKR